MKRIQYHAYGGPGVMRLENYTCPAPKKGEVRVRVRASSINPLDWKLRQGFMKLMMGGKFPHGMGQDFSGVVDTIGEDVTGFVPGDEVLGTAPMKASGSFADAVVTTANLLIKKPPSLSFNAAAALPTIGVTAWRALIDAATLTAGKTVFINGAAGGVGQAAIYIAKAAGALVTVRVGSSWIAEARALGLTQVLNYNEPLPVSLKGAFDIVFDCHGSLTPKEEMFLIKPSGVAVDIEPTFGNIVRSIFSPRHQFVRGMPSTTILLKVADLATGGQFPISMTSVPLVDAITLIGELEAGKRVPGKAVIEVA
jgi:NADPH:quinone reductase-like Zn-dependent oxidoreductase